MSEKVEPPKPLPVRPPVKHKFSPLRVGLWVIMALLLCLILVSPCSPLTCRDRRIFEAMKKTSASRAATELATAIRNYYSEYTVLPLSGGPTDLHLDTSSNSGLIGILMSENTHGILFFSDRKAKAHGKPGLWFEGEELANAELFDSWGNYYQVILDTNWDGKLEVPKRGGNPGETEIIEDMVAVWSYGPNGVPGQGSERLNDDIYTYREY